MIKYNLSQFTSIIINRETIGREIGIIEQLSKKIGNNVQKHCRYVTRKTIIKITDLKDVKITLNKITDDNYNKLIILLKTLCKNITSRDDICEILQIISSKTLFIDLSAKIYYELICENELFLAPAVDKFNSLYNDIIETSAVLTLDVSYDNLCINNKKIDCIKNQVQFYSALVYYNIPQISSPDLLLIIPRLLENVNQYIYIEIIYNIISKCTDIFNKYEEKNGIVITLNQIKNKKGIYEHISNKILFKTMDILDLI